LYVINHCKHKKQTFTTKDVLTKMMTKKFHMPKSV